MAYKMLYLEKPPVKPFAKVPYVKDKEVALLTERIYKDQEVLTEEELAIMLRSRNGKPFAKYLKPEAKKKIEDQLMEGEHIVEHPELNSLGYTCTNFYRVFSLKKSEICQFTLNVTNGLIDNWSKRGLRIYVREWLYEKYTPQQLIEFWDEKNIKYAKRNWKGIIKE
jgi:hypothetical protein